MKAFVDATPISGPARVGARMSLSRAIVDVVSLTTATIFCPFALAARRLAKVSAVSPDCETKSSQPSWLKRRIAITEFGGDFDIDRQACEALEPIFGDKPGVIGRAAAADRQTPERGDIDGRHEGQRSAASRHIEIMRKGPADRPPAVRGFPSP